MKVLRRYIACSARAMDRTCVMDKTQPGPVLARKISREASQLRHTPSGVLFHTVQLTSDMFLYVLIGYHMPLFMIALDEGVREG